MSWRDLLQQEETITVPWTGGRLLSHRGRSFQVAGALPLEHGFHEFAVSGGRRASWRGPSPLTADAYFDDDAERVRGYLLGDRLASDQSHVVADLSRLVAQTERVHLVEPGLERYARIVAARSDDGRLFFLSQEFPLGPEDAVRDAFVRRLPSVDGVPGVSPALDLAFRLESWQRDEVVRRRMELEEEERRAQARRQHGDGAGRRNLARTDFEAAARAALAVAGAELLDHRAGYRRGEHVVQFRLHGRRFECVADTDLRIVDAGICLVDHDTGERGDTRFTLESLPGVIAQAIDEGVLVIFRHAGDEEED